MQPSASRLIFSPVLPSRVYSIEISFGVGLYECAEGRRAVGRAVALG